MLAIAALTALAVVPAAAAQPNVLLVLTDDQRWDTLRYMPTVQSELVDKGVTFSNAFVVNPVCCPSRATILTGTYSHTNGVWGVRGPHGGFHVFSDRSTLPVWLDAAGYETMLAGKYLNGYGAHWAPATYVPPGWDSWFAYWPSGNAYFDYGATDGSTALAFGSEPADYATDVLAERAVDFIRDSGRAPFFLYFAPKAPHVDAVASVTLAPRHVGRFEGLEPWRPPNLNEPNMADKPRYLRAYPPLDTGRVAELRQEQLESLLAVDEAIAGMLAALEETGKLANTLIVFTSDNGYAWGEHRRFHKVAPYEESIRVPLVIRWDARGFPVRTERRLALNLDLAETIAAAGGIAVGTEGRDLLPLMAGTPRWRTSFLFETYMQGSKVPAYCAFRSSRWKYVQYATGEEEVYNLRWDPYELRSQHRAKRPLVMSYRAQVRASKCRPPGYRPLALCTRTGTQGPDWIRGWSRRDWICAGRGHDRVNVLRGGKDIVRCGPGFDRVRADRRDVLRGCERRGRRLRLQ